MTDTNTNPTTGSGPPAVAAAVFLTALTATMPAGILPAMGAGLGVDSPTAAQTVTAYALGAALTAIPLTAAGRLRRKPVLLNALAAFALAVTITAQSSSFPLTLGARLVAGAAAGLVWAATAGHTGRLTLAMAGIPLGLILGPAAGALLGDRFAFGATGIVAIVVLGWIAVTVSNSPGRPSPARPRALRTMRVAGVAAVLFSTLVLAGARLLLPGRSDLVVLAVGAAILIGAWAVVTWTSRRLPVTAVLAIAAAVTGVGLLAGHPAPVYLAVVLAGLAWAGGSAPRMTTGGEPATLWIAAMATGVVAGGVLLGLSPTGSVPWVLLSPLVAVLAAGLTAHTHGLRIGLSRDPAPRVRLARRHRVSGTPCRGETRPCEG
ncbi:MFS transporter [Phytomonospora endophytica]|uniref:MFS family permease n=1 Tax=Phytomonospora endophytica TaxID=714109 RepID=A0A841FSC8_9ACTN|nr:MFS transporter [Phytomonospora endophytica]MBB6038704.1 MFS family permease [Phytomonospora endophytica]GIG68499.1 MFS transporter [Phytomonospora endophytica]